MLTDDPDDRIVILSCIRVVNDRLGTRKLPYDVPVAVFSKYRGKRSIFCCPFTWIMNFPKEERNKFTDNYSLRVHMLLIYGPLFLSSDVPIFLCWGVRKKNMFSASCYSPSIIGHIFGGEWTPTGGTCRSTCVASLMN